MSQTLSPSVAAVMVWRASARVWSISRASVYRALKETQPNTPPRRPGPGRRMFGRRMWQRISAVE